jgi:hypothetical protein
MHSVCLTSPRHTSISPAAACSHELSPLCTTTELQGTFASKGQLRCRLEANTRARVCVQIMVGVTKAMIAATLMSVVVFAGLKESRLRRKGHFFVLHRGAHTDC